MTTKTDSFGYTENPLSTSWTVVTANGPRAAGAGAFANSNNVWCVALWKTSDYTFANDQSAEITYASQGVFDLGAACVRWATTGGGVGYMAHVRNDSSEVRVDYWTAGAFSSRILTISAVTFADGDKLKLDITGTTLTVYKNGASIGSVVDTNIASGQAAIGCYNGNINVTRITLWTGVDAAASGPNITSVSTATPREGASLTITGTAFGASQGSGDVKINGVAQTVTSWSDTSIAVTIVLGTNKFGAAYTVVVRDNALTASNSYAGITGLLPANSGLSYIDLGTPNATAAYRITAIADLASGDQLEYENVGGLVAVASDATFSAGPGVLDFDCRAWTSGSGYGASASQNTSTAGSGTGVSKLRYAGVSFPSRLQASVSYYDP